MLNDLLGVEVMMDSQDQIEGLLIDLAESIAREDASKKIIERYKSALEQIKFTEHSHIAKIAFEALAP